MTGDDYGPLRSYQVTWKSGHVETVQGHQVLFDSARSGTGDYLVYGFGTATAFRTADLPPRFTIHGKIDGHWRLVLIAFESELVSLRDVTEADRLEGST